MARSSLQNEKMRGDKNEKIKKEALRQFSRKGLSGTKIKDIAEGVGMAQGLIYHYYPSKDAIYSELINDALDMMNEAVTALRDMPSEPHEKIRAAVIQLLSTIESSDDFNQTCRLISQAANSEAMPEAAQKAISEKRNLPYREIAKIIKEGQTAGSLRSGDPEELAMIFWTSVNGLAIFKAMTPESSKIPDPQLLIRIFLKEELL